MDASFRATENALMIKKTTRKTEFQGENVRTSCLWIVRAFAGAIKIILQRISRDSARFLRVQPYIVGNDAANARCDREQFSDWFR